MVASAYFGRQAISQPDLRLGVRRLRRPQPESNALLALLVIVALGLLGALPCVTHCELNHDEALATHAEPGLVAMFLCDLPAPVGAPEGQTAPHHHHVVPQMPLDPPLAFAGMLPAALLLSGRLFMRRFLACRSPLAAPPTPPPRLA
jgi:hypothetical protein